jgi:hypothetical protein
MRPQGPLPTSPFVCLPLRLKPERLPQTVIAAICVGGINTSAFFVAHRPAPKRGGEALH